MNIKLNTEIKLKFTPIDEENEREVEYICSSAHRRNQKDKSYWLISPLEEVACFQDSQINKYIDDIGSWGFMKEKSLLKDLGINDFNEFLKIGKFVDKDGKNIWHGYPADFVRKPQDRPSISILKKWREAGVIEKHHAIKIRQGKKCNL